MFNQLQDNALISVHPSALIDMALGGNIRRKRRNFEEFKAKIKAQGIIQPVVARPIKGNESQLELFALSPTKTYEKISERTTTPIYKGYTICTHLYPLQL